MLALQIDDKEIEETLGAKFSNLQEINKYIYDLVMDDIEDQKLGKILNQSQTTEFVSKEEIFSVLDNI